MRLDYDVHSLSFSRESNLDQSWCAVLAGTELSPCTGMMSLVSAVLECTVIDDVRTSMAYSSTCLFVGVN